jgi:hypothetical protein
MKMLRNPNNLRLDLFGLDVACEILGCMNAWVSRHSGTICQMLLMLDNAMDDDIALKNILTKSAKKAQISNLFLLPWKNNTLLCAPIVAADGYTYLLGMIFPGHFEVTDRVSGVVDGLRCCLHALINQRLVVHHSESMKPQSARSRVAAACTYPTMGGCTGMIIISSRLVADVHKLSARNVRWRFTMMFCRIMFNLVVSHQF